MYTPWIKEEQLARTLARHEAFWQGELEGYPLTWVTVPNAVPGKGVPEPADEEELWTNVDYVIDSTEDRLRRTYFAGDALPVYVPWLGPDQFAGWLGADLIFRPREHNTSWVIPFIKDWADHRQFTVDRDNRWWKLYLELVRRSVEAGKGKWVTGYPDLHTGIDALCAMRGAEQLALDLVDNPDALRTAMRQMTELWKYVVDVVTDLILPTGQGSTNWTTGWSAGRFLCIGQNDFTCLLSPLAFREFCLEDNRECTRYVDCTMYHLDGPGAIRHLPEICEIAELNCVQWIPGAGAPPQSQWIELLKQIQELGKTVQVWPLWNCSLDSLLEEVGVLCRELDPTRLFIVAEVPTVAEAEALVRITKEASLSSR